MRSRYSAFSTGEVQYLLDTQRLDGVSREQLEASVASTRWLGLSVLHSSSAGDEGEVEFIARYKDAQGLGQLHERSRFRREQGRWLYVGGRHLPPPKPQRNDPCWCGSGKKLKKCCGA
jgi:SEC-C motif-containing protein